MISVKENLNYSINFSIGLLFSVHDQFLLPTVDGDENSEGSGQFERDTRRALRKTDWIRRPKK